MPHQLQIEPDRIDLERFHLYAATYHDLFDRADQRECFRLYLHGLLTAPGRKNVKGIAATATRARVEANVGQALQHFVTQSPWDSGRVLARYRALIPPALREGNATWAIHDGVLLKKGRNSVGTQRQFARPLGRKVNCQIAVVVGWDSPAGSVPLAIRLYLPGYWLREYPALAERTVPVGQRSHATKTEIAISLLDQLRVEGWAADAAAIVEGYAATEGFTRSLAERGIRIAGERQAPLDVAGARFEWLKTRLGLDHFEGRTWTGWHHHVAMVFAAAGFLLGNPSPTGK